MSDGNDRSHTGRAGSLSGAAIGRREAHRGDRKLCGEPRHRTLLILASLGVAPGRALAVMVSGAVGSPTALADTLVFMAPRLLVALGAMVALRCGVFNLGGEGQLQMGAVGAVLPATLAAASLGWLSLPASLCLAAAFGALWATHTGALKLWRGADVIIVTLMMNFIGIYLVKYLVQGPLQPPGSEFNMSAKVPRRHAADPAWRHAASCRCSAGVGAAVACGFCSTKRPTESICAPPGLSPRAARLQRLPTRRLLLGSMAISGRHRRPCRRHGGAGRAVQADRWLQRQYRLRRPRYRIPGKPRAASRPCLLRSTSARSQAARVALQSTLQRSRLAVRHPHRPAYRDPGLRARHPAAEGKAVVVIDTIALGLFLASAVRLERPLMLAGLGELVSERAGVFNVGLEGIMLVAAFAAAADPWAHRLAARRRGDRHALRRARRQRGSLLRWW